MNAYVRGIATACALLLAIPARAICPPTVVFAGSATVSSNSLLTIQLGDRLDFRIEYLPDMPNQSPDFTIGVYFGTYCGRVSATVGPRTFTCLANEVHVLDQWQANDPNEPPVDGFVVRGGECVDDRGYIARADLYLFDDRDDVAILGTALPLAPPDFRLFDRGAEFVVGYSSPSSAVATLDAFRLVPEPCGADLVALLALALLGHRRRSAIARPRGDVEAASRSTRRVTSR